MDLTGKLLILRKAKDMAFEDVLEEGCWSKEKKQMLEEEYYKLPIN